MCTCVLTLLQKDYVVRLLIALAVFLQFLTQFVNTLAAGLAPSTITPHFCGASLLACRKKSGGHWPIVVGEVLRHRLVFKCLAFLCLPEGHLSPVTSTVGGWNPGRGGGGCEAVIHATSRLISSLPSNQCWTLLLHFTNAFNNVSRKAMFVEFRHHLSGLSAWIESSYSCQPHLHLSDYIIHSCCGVQQGDTLGPLGFSLTLHSVVKQIAADIPSLILVLR